MRRPACRALLLGTLLLAVAGPARASEPEAEDGVARAVAQARDRVFPALVNIGVVTRQFSGGRAVRYPSAGSGVVVSPAGHVLTNFHVVEGAVRVTCLLTDGEKVDADVLVEDPLTDLAVLKLRMDRREDPSKPLFFASLGDSDALHVGDVVLAMGNPRTLSSTVTQGIVAAKDRVFKSFTGSDIDSMEFEPGNLTGLLTRWIQHDALIQPGNSGGPLVNLAGEVVGINALGGGGMSFAIPSNLAKRVLNQALTFGEVRRGWLGVSVQPVEAFDREGGALVGSVEPGGPLDVAGIRPGDVIVRLGGRDVNVRVLDDVPLFYAEVADLPVGSEQTLVYERDREQQAVTVKIARMQRFLGEERVFPELGISARAITAPMALANGWPDTKGVVVTSLRPGKPPEVARPSLGRGDVILELGGQPVDDLDALARLEEANAKNPSLLVRFRRDREEMVTALDMTREPPRRRGSELPKAWLGVQTQVLIPEVAKALGMEDRQGYRITRVLPGTQAEKAGLRVGDAILGIDGEPLKAYRLQDAELLRRKVEDMDIGVDVSLQILRDGKEMTVDVELEETPSTAAEVKSAEDTILEYSVRELTYLDKVDRDWPLDIQGLLVKDVENGGWANLSGLRAGDLIQRIQGTPIVGIDDFEAATKRLAEDRPEFVRIFVRRGISTAYVFIQPDWPR